MITVEELREWLDKYDDKSEVLISLGGGEPVRTIVGMREGTILKDIAPILNRSKHVVAFTPTNGETVAVILA